MERGSLIYVAGHNGMVGSAIVKNLRSKGFHNLITRDSQELDLRNQVAVRDFFEENKPEYVFIAAAKVGGILANDQLRADFIYDNLLIQSNLIFESNRTQVKKLLFLGSSCIYPKLATQPIKEDSLLTGPLEPTNESYAIAKIAGIRMCQDFSKQYGANFISVMPSNLYGYGDNYHPVNSHVIPGMIRKFHDAKTARINSVRLWGNGDPFREFLFSDDLAEACVFLMLNYNSSEIINVGSGEEISIKELASKVQGVIGFNGDVIWDESRPNGTPRKIMDSSKIFSYGWKPKINLDKGLKLSYEDFLTKEKQ